eukprot:TRINITY_DN22660_c0_g1_i1.p2 TRINITY_DN22660_c0_g1~~TRINITY_DN22660_c0_g1_i1.p2  ORF type:complete len:212 (+),score=77.57 TRINITY_DN22660_c0_g1_i1:75-638(+)
MAAAAAVLLSAAAGALSAADERRLLAAADRQDVINSFVAYTDAVDRSDWAAYRELFTEDAEIDYEAAGGRKGGPKEISEWLESAFSFFIGAQHLVSNFNVTVTGDRATIRCMFHNPVGLRHLPWPRPFFLVGGWYNVELVRQPGGNWLIQRLWEEIAYNQAFTNAVLLAVLIGAALLHAIRRLLPTA